MDQPLSRLIMIALLAASCSGEKVKEKINRAGDVAGQAVGELATGVSSGVEKVMGVRVEVSAPLAAKGIRLGKVTVSDSLEAGQVLNVYTIFDQAFDTTITAKVYDQEQVEMGRSRVKVTAAKDEARFIGFTFDRRTGLDHHCQVILE